MKSGGMGERKRLILKAIIEEYVAYAEPVGSKAISERSKLGLSAATIRNEMADLEALGLLDQPHTSAGRVPSQAGYRYYVDEIMGPHALSEREIGELRHAMQTRLRELDRVIAAAGRLVSDMTKYAALSVTPHISGDVIKKIELFACDLCLYVFVMVSAAGLVNNKLIRTHRAVDEEDLLRLAKRLNEVLVGNAPANITLKQISQLESGAGGAEELLNLILDYIKDVMSEYTTTDLHVDGAANLLYYPEFRNLDKARDLLAFLDEANDGKWLASRESDPVEIRIGKENDAKQLHDSSLIIAEVRLAEKAKGYIGVIGPTRMDYAKISARLRYLAGGLSKIMTDVLNEKEPTLLEPHHRSDHVDEEKK